MKLTNRSEGTGRAAAWGWLLCAGALGACGGCSQESTSKSTSEHAASAPSSAPTAAAAQSAAPAAQTTEPQSKAKANVASARPSSPAPSSSSTTPPAAPRPAPEKKGAPTETKPVAQAQPIAPVGPQIELGELLVTRDLWPATVALTKPMTIARGVTLPIGHELRLWEFNGSDIALDTGDDVFECPASSTDVVARASTMKAKLTPEQLALNDNTLTSHPELWPVRATLTRRMEFQNGKKVPAGRELTVRSVGIGWVELFDRELNDHFQAETFETDVIARARERMLLPEAQRSTFLFRSIAATLEPSSTASDPTLEKTDYVLVYRARLGCTRCAAFAPELAKFYERVKPAHPNFETVFFSDDKTPENARTVFATEKFPGRAIAFERRDEAADLSNRLTGELLPLVYLFDKNGQVVANCHPSGGSPSATDILAVLEKKLNEPR